MSLAPLNMSYGNSMLTTGQSLAADSKSLASLKMNAGTSSPEAIKETAKQFESLFMRELIKSMRDATMKSGLMEGEQANLGQDMLDQQLEVLDAYSPQLSANGLRSGRFLARGGTARNQDQDLAGAALLLVAGDLD